ncbi:MAG: hypothetical protein K6347_00900 [Campylobacterales bacterium]
MSRLITAILPNHHARKVLTLLHERGIVTANRYFARGTSIISGRQNREMEVLEVVVEEDMAEEIFEFIYDAGEIGRAGGGIIYQQHLTRSTKFILPPELLK